MWGSAREKTTLLSYLEREKKGFESKAQLCFPVLAFALFCGSAFPPQLSRRKLAAVPALRHGAAIVSEQMDQQTARGLGAHGAAPRHSPTLLGPGGQIVTSFLAPVPGVKDCGAV